MSRKLVDSIPFSMSKESLTNKIWQYDRLINQWKFQVEENRKSCPYIQIEPSEIPNDWNNDLDDIGVFDYFRPFDENYIVPDIKKYFGLPNPRPVMYNHGRSVYRIDDGNGSYYLYNNMSDQVLKLYERNLDNILCIKRSDRS